MDEVGRAALLVPKFTEASCGSVKRRLKPLLSAACLSALPTALQTFIPMMKTLFFQVRRPSLEESPAEIVCQDDSFWRQADCCTSLTVCISKALAGNKDRCVNIFSDRSHSLQVNTLQEQFCNGIPTGRPSQPRMETLAFSCGLRLGPQEKKRKGRTN